jgi:hypothetical protein
VVVSDVTLAVGGPATTGTGYETDLSLMNGTSWEGVLALEGVETGDGRKFSDGSLTWMDEPMPLRWNKVDSHGGVPATQAVTVGRINEVYRDPQRPNYIMGRGVFDDTGAEGAEALRLVRDGFLSGVSIDPDSIKDADVEMVFPPVDENASDEEQMMQMFAAPDLMIFHAGRIRAATLVDIPAFAEAKIWLAGAPNAPTGMPMPGMSGESEHFAHLSDHAWNGPENERRLAQRMTVATAHRAFAYVTPSTGQPMTTVSARFLHHEISDTGAVQHANLTACSAGIRAINAGRAEALTSAERRAAYEHMASHLRSAGMVPPPYDVGDVIVAAGRYDDLVRPPAWMFADPKLSGPTPLTIDDDGHVYGHGAVWGTCHTGFANTCVSPPTEGEHAYFRLGEVATSDGSRVAVGHITLGTGHAPVRGISASQAAEHYDNTGSVVAVVASGEDAHGIWIAGAIRPGVPEARVQELRAASLSGDWRRIGGKLRLVAFLAVNRPGFPVPRTTAFTQRDEQLSLVAAGIISQNMRHVRRDGEGAHAAMMRIARSIGRDPQSRMQELRTRMGR